MKIPNRSDHEIYKSFKLTKSPRFSAKSQARWNGFCGWLALALEARWGARLIHLFLRRQTRHREIYMFEKDRSSDRNEKGSHVPISSEATGVWSGPSSTRAHSRVRCPILFDSVVLRRAFLCCAHPKTKKFCRSLSDERKNITDNDRSSSYESCEKLIYLDELVMVVKNPHFRPVVNGPRAGHV